MGLISFTSNTQLVGQARTHPNLFALPLSVQFHQSVAEWVVLNVFSKPVCAEGKLFYRFRRSAQHISFPPQPLRKAKNRCVPRRCIAKQAPKTKCTGRLALG